MNSLQKRSSDTVILRGMSTFQRHLKAQVPTNPSFKAKDNGMLTFKAYVFAYEGRMRQ